MLLTTLKKFRSWSWKRRYRAGMTISQFIAPDVRRDVEVIDAARAGNGVLVVRTRTWNVLYAHRGLAPQPPLGEVRTVQIKDLWKWPGEPWGGPVPASLDAVEG